MEFIVLHVLSDKMADEENSGMLKDQQLVLIAADPHIDDLVVPDALAEDAQVLPAKVIQLPVKVAEQDKVETKMAALIMVEPEDLPPDAHKIIKDEIKEVSASYTPAVVPKSVNSEDTVALPPFDPYYYVGKLPSNFANSLTTNVSTNSLSMQKVAVDSTKLVDMLNMAKLSTQLSSINDSIHSFVVTSEPSESGRVRFRGDTSSGIYSSSPCQSSDGFSKVKDKLRQSESQKE